jgi:hypothetical protein
MSSSQSSEWTPEGIEYALQKRVDDAMGDVIADFEEFLDDSGVNIDIDYYERVDDPLGDIKVGDTIFEVEYKVTRKLLLENPQST